MASESLPNSMFESLVSKGAHLQHWACIIPLISFIIYQRSLNSRVVNAHLSFLTATLYCISIFLTRVIFSVGVNRQTSPGCCRLTVLLVLFAVPALRFLPPATADGGRGFRGFRARGDSGIVPHCPVLPLPTKYLFFPPSCLQKRLFLPSWNPRVPWLLHLSQNPLP